MLITMFTGTEHKSTKLVINEIINEVTKTDLIYRDSIKRNYKTKKQGG
jgi:hypothetical protein